MVFPVWSRRRVLTCVLLTFTGLEGDPVTSGTAGSLMRALLLGAPKFPRLLDKHGCIMPQTGLSQGGFGTWKWVLGITFTFPVRTTPRVILTEKTHPGFVARTLFIVQNCLLRVLPNPVAPCVPVCVPMKRLWFGGRFAYIPFMIPRNTNRPLGFPLVLLVKIPKDDHLI